VQFETKFLFLRTPVTLGSRFGDWQVCWLAGWSKRRFAYVVMVVRVCPVLPTATKSMDKGLAWDGHFEPFMVTAQITAPEGNDMNVFMITADNEVQPFASNKKVPAGGAVFGSVEQLAALVRDSPAARLVEVWNQPPGAKPVSKFSDRNTAVRRLWNVLSATAPQHSQQRHTSPQGTKTEKILALLRQPYGATLDTLMAATQ